MPGFANGDAQRIDGGRSASAPQNAREDQGRRNALSGSSAEDSVLREYERSGGVKLHQRWRCEAGEIDLILRDGATYVFVEVKTSATFERAIAQISPRQVSRIYRAAEVFLGTTPEGGFADVRFDVGLVNGQGEVRIMQGALLPY